VTNAAHNNFHISTRHRRNGTQRIARSASQANTRAQYFFRRAARLRLRSRYGHLGYVTIRSLLQFKFPFARSLIVALCAPWLMRDDDQQIWDRAVRSLSICPSPRLRILVLPHSIEDEPHSKPTRFHCSTLHPLRLPRVLKPRMVNGHFKVRRTSHFCSLFFIKAQLPLYAQWLHQVRL